jgi:hypothetical protein
MSKIGTNLWHLCTIPAAEPFKIYIALLWVDFLECGNKEIKQV